MKKLIVLNLILFGIIGCKQTNSSKLSNDTNSSSIESSQKAMVPYWEEPIIIKLTSEMKLLLRKIETIISTKSIEKPSIEVSINNIMDIVNEDDSPEENPPKTLKFSMKRSLSHSYIPNLKKALDKEFDKKNLRDFIILKHYLNDLLEEIQLKPRCYIGKTEGKISHSYRQGEDYRLFEEKDNSCIALSVRSFLLGDCTKLEECGVAYTNNNQKLIISGARGCEKVSKETPWPHQCVIYIDMNNQNSSMVPELENSLK